MAWYTGMMRAMTKLQRGYESPGALYDMLIERYGLLGLMKWGARVDANVAASSAALGEAATQFHMALAGMFYGCTFCSRGHLYAANLYYFRDTGQLFPISEHDIVPLMDKRDSEIIAYLDEVLAASPEVSEFVVNAKRQLALAHDEVEPETDVDGHLAALNGSWDWITYCTVPVGYVEEVTPQAKIARDKALIARYQAARTAARGD